MSLKDVTASSMNNSILCLVLKIVLTKKNLRMRKKIYCGRLLAKPVPTKCAALDKHSFQQGARNSVCVKQENIQSLFEVELNSFFKNTYN